MANKITQDQIIEMNRLYLRIKTYAGVAREVGVSAGTVKKYIIPNFIDPNDIEVKSFDKQTKPIEEINAPKDWAAWIKLNTEEEEEIKELWKELVV